MDSEQFRALLRAYRQLQEVEATSPQWEASIHFSSRASREPVNPLCVGEILALKEAPSGAPYAGFVTASSQKTMILKLPWRDSARKFQVGQTLYGEYWKRRSVFKFEAPVVSYDPIRKVLELAQPQEVMVAPLGSRDHRRNLQVSLTVFHSRTRDLLGKQVSAAPVEGMTQEGLTFRSPIALGLGDRISMVLRLPETTRVMACVSEYSEPDPSEAGLRTVRATFTGFDSEDHNRLLLYIVKNFGELQDS